MHVLLLGATGVAGRKTAAELLRQPAVDALWLCGRKQEELDDLAAAFGNPDRLRPRAFDLSEASLHGNLFRDADVVVSCAGPGYATEEPAARAAVEGGAAYISLCDDAAGLEGVRPLNDRAVAAGVPVISGCGLSPGITNLLIAHGETLLDAVDSIDISLARSSVESHGEATTHHLLYELAHEAPVVKDHRQVGEPSGSAPRLIFFPEPIGWVETFRIGHPEVLTLPQTYPDVAAVQFRVGLAERITMDTARAFGATPLARNETARSIFVAATKPLRPLIDRLPPRGPAWSGARVDLHGRKDSAPKTVSLAVVDRLLNFTSATLTLATLRLGEGAVRATGVVPVEAAFDPQSFLRDLSRRGIAVAELEPSPV